MRIAAMLAHASTMHVDGCGYIEQDAWLSGAQRICSENSRVGRGEMQRIRVRGEATRHRKSSAPDRACENLHV